MRYEIWVSFLINRWVLAVMLNLWFVPVFFHLRNITRIRSLVSKEELEMLVHAFISSRLDYCTALYTCLNKSTMDKLQVVQNAAARLLAKTNRRSHITPVLKALHWLPMSFRVQFKILTITYRALHHQAPSYIQDLFHIHSPGRSLRSSGQDLFTAPRTRLKTRGDRAFCVVALELSSISLESFGLCRKF